ncbi:MAG TPA: dipeptide epimerase [Elusimicrobia bacterium]|nr:dipeptide epimerase [Elusimicrobiota bacterium]
MGAVTPVGNSVGESWEALCSGQSGIGPITKFDAAAFDTRIAGELKGFDPLRYVTKRERRRYDDFIIFALAAAEMAVLDALARTMKMPFWRLYGEKPAPARTDITVVIGTPEQAFDFASFYRARGMKIFKIKVGIDYDNDLRRLAAVRRAAPKAEIFLDANCAWTVREARSFIRDLGRAGIRPSVLEQPVKKDDFGGLAALSRDFDFPVCADESLYSLRDAVRLLRAGVSGLNIKLMKLGLSQSLEVYRLARASGAKLMMGEMLESRLSSLCAAHFAAGLGGFDFIDLDTPLFIKDRVTAGFAGPGPDGIYDLAGVKAGIGAVPKIFAER